MNNKKLYSLLQEHLAKIDGSLMRYMVTQNITLYNRLNTIDGELMEIKAMMSPRETENE